MKNWDKGKKDNRRLNVRAESAMELPKKKKLKPIEKDKYRLKGYDIWRDDEA